MGGIIRTVVLADLHRSHDIQISSNYRTCILHVVLFPDAPGNVASYHSGSIPGGTCVGAGQNDKKYAKELIISHVDNPSNNRWKDVLNF